MITVATASWMADTQNTHLYPSASFTNFNQRLPHIITYASPYGGTVARHEKRHAVHADPEPALVGVEHVRNRRLDEHLDRRDEDALYHLVGLPFARGGDVVVPDHHALGMLVVVVGKFTHDMGQRAQDVHRPLAECEG